MHAGGGAERVPTHHGVVGGDGEPHRPGHRLAVLREVGEIVVDVAGEAEVDQDLVHGRVAAAFPHPQRGAVQLVHPGQRGGDGVDGAQTAVVVAVPVDLHVLAGVRRHLAHVAHDGPRPRGNGVAHGVGDGDAPRPRPDGRGVEGADRLRGGPGGVLGDEHHGEAVPHAEPDRLLGVAHQLGQVPGLGVEADGARPHEHGHLDGHAGLLRDVGDGLAVLDHGAGGRVGAQLHAAGGLAHEGEGVLVGAGTGGGKPHVRGVDAEGLHEPQDADLGVDVRVGDGGGLEAVAQGLVVERDRAPGELLPLPVPVPVVDQLVTTRFVGQRSSGARLSPSSRGRDT